MDQGSKKSVSLATAELDKAERDGAASSLTCKVYPSASGMKSTEQQTRGAVRQSVYPTVPGRSEALGIPW